MSQFVLTDEQASILFKAREPVEVLDNKGQVLTYLKPLWTNEEIAEAKRRAASPGPWYSGAQVRARLQALEKEWERTGGFDQAYLKDFLAKLNGDDPGEMKPKGSMS